MKYMGSKNRIAKEILPIILKDRKENQFYIEPFVGGANLIDKVPNPRIGSDLNENVILALNCIQNHLYLIPKDNKEFTEEDYKNIKKSGQNDVIAYVGFALSYSGKWFGGWCRDKDRKRDYVKEAYKNALKQHPKLQGINLIHSDYRSLFIPKNSIIYCDIPYKNTTKYKNNDFDYNVFWEWCRNMTKKGHKVFISEYNAPEDFKCIWQKEQVSSLTKNTGSKRAIEKLFIWSSKEE